MGTDQYPGAAPGDEASEEAGNEESGEATPDALELATAELARATAEHYEDAALYDHEYRRRRADVRWYRGLAREVAAATGARSLQVLELGCGSGRLLIPLVRDGHTVLGVDRSAPMLRRCAERIAAPGTLGRAARSRVRLVRADFRRLPLGLVGRAAPSEAASRFPLILCPFNSFMHLYTRQDVEACLAEVRRLLAPDGIFALDVLNPDPAWLARDPLRRWSRTRFRHPRTGERFIYTTNHVYDAETQVAWIRIYYEPDPPSAGSDGPLSGVPRGSGREDRAENALTRTVHLAHRQFYPAELESLLYYNGFALSARLGGFDGQPLTPESAEQVICARIR
jgi:SAM-dependent methyltransferase